jgi:hypothetical protein
MVALVQKRPKPSASRLSRSTHAWNWRVRLSRRGGSKQSRVRGRAGVTALDPEVTSGSGCVRLPVLPWCRQPTGGWRASRSRWIARQLAVWWDAVWIGIRKSRKRRLGRHQLAGSLGLLAWRRGAITRRGRWLGDGFDAFLSGPYGSSLGLSWGLGAFRHGFVLSARSRG